MSDSKTTTEGAVALDRIVILSREWVPHEIQVTKVVWWWLAGWERKLWKHVDTCARTPRWLMPSKYRLNLLLAQACKRRIWQVRRRQAVARVKEAKDNKLIYDSGQMHE